MRSFDRVAVLGLGYVGLPTAALAAAAGYDVLGVDTDSGILSTLKSGEVHISEPGLRMVVRAAIEGGKLRLSERLESADAFVMCVPTPVEGRRADLTAVEAAARAVGAVLRRGDLVVLESTVPPGTTKGFLAKVLRSVSSLEPGEDFPLAYCPERVLPGAALKELVNNDRLMGGVDGRSARAAATLYSRFVDGALIKCDALEAEICKLAENAFRDVNIAFANELARLCETHGADVWRVLDLANRHPRVNILRPGAGVGGHCIPVDPWMLLRGTEETSLISTARTLNDDQPVFVARSVLRFLEENDVSEPAAAIFGVTYKADVDDVRNSPAAEAARTLVEGGVALRFCDPHVRRFQGREVVSAAAAVEGADLLLFMTAHSAWAQLEPDKLAARMRRRLLYDATGLIDLEAWRTAGMEVRRFGLGERGEDSSR